MKFPLPELAGAWEAFEEAFEKRPPSDARCDLCDGYVCNRLLHFLADENAALRAQLAEAVELLERRGTVCTGGIDDCRCHGCLTRDLLAKLRGAPWTASAPPSDEDVRAALVRIILDKTGLDDICDRHGIVCEIMEDPLLGRLLRGGR